VLATITFFAALPISVSVAYVALGPSVSDRPITVCTLAAVAGLIASAASLYRAALPLKSIGIAGTAVTGEPPSTLSGLLTPRLVIAGFAVTILTVAIAYSLDRVLPTSS
jgi:hypothetical protein